MRISQKLDYAQRAVLHLSKNYDGKTVARLDNISEVQEIPASFLVQILTDLKKSGIVISKRGKTGGYLLAKAPSDITIGNVIEAIEPQLMEEADGFEGESAAVLSNVWKELSKGFSNKVNKITIDDLLSEDREPMWFI